MTVYIEQVVLDNFGVNLVIAYAALRCLRLNVKWLRLIVASLIGTAFAVVFPFISHYVFWFKLCCAAVMTAVFYTGKGVRGYILTLIAFIGFSFLLGGAVLGIYYFPLDVKGSFSLPGNGIIGLTILGTISALWLLKALKRAYIARTHLYEQTLDVSFKSGERAFQGLAEVDSGNNLYDNLTGKPVVILSKGLAELNGRERFIEVKTVSGNKALPLVVLKEFRIKGRDCGTVLAAVTDAFDEKVILHTALVKEVS